MVVATGASKCQTQKRLAKRIHFVVDAIGLVLRNVNRRVNLLAQKPEARADHRLICTRDRVDPRILDEVAGDLLSNELVVWQIVIEGLHDPIAVTPDIWNRKVKLMAAGLAVANHIQPMPRETFPIVRRRQQAIDKSVECQWIGMAGHLLGIGGIGRQACEHLAGPTHEHRKGCFGRGLDPGCFESREHKAINVAAAPLGILNLRRRHNHRGPPTPVSCFPAGDVEGLDGTGCFAVIGPRQTATHPLLDRGNRRCGELAIGGHLRIAVVSKNLHDQALVGPASHRHALSGEKIRLGIKRETTLGFTGHSGMALGTVSHKDGPHF